MERITFEIDEFMAKVRVKKMLTFELTYVVLSEVAYKFFEIIDLKRLLFFALIFLQIL